MTRINKFKCTICLFGCLQWMCCMAQCAGIEIHQVDTMNYPLLKAYISFFDQGGAINSVKSSEIKASIENGQTLQVKKMDVLTNSNEPIAVLIAVDTSRSMKKKHIQAIQKASRSLMENKRSFDKLALIGFNDDVFVLSKFTTDSTKFSNAVDKLKTGGQITVLYKGIYMGLEMLDSPELPMLRYMIVISDGKNEGVGFTLDDAIEKAQKINVPIYSMGFVTRKSNAKYLDYLIRLSSKTGGEYQKINHSDDFQSAYRKFGIKIQNQYVIDFLSDVDGDGENHILEIHYMPGSQLKRIARHSFIAPNKINALQKSTFEKTASVEEAVTITTVANTPVNSTKHEAHSSAMFQHLPLIGTLLLLLLLSSFLVWFIIRYHSSKLNTDYNQLNETTGTPQNENYYLELFIAELDLIKPLISGSIRIGYYDDNHLVLKADTVSGYHAELSGNGCDWIIKDLGSTNGVRVNGKKISDSSSLNENDMIKIGPYELFMRSKT